MEKFSLEKYLENPSRKVVTRDGRPVRIVCWDMKSMSPIVGIIQDRLGGEFIRSYALNGRYSTKNESEYDLFFADEEEEFTEFEKVLKEVIEDVQNGDYIEEESFDFWKDKLLDLARKELEANYYTKVLDDRMVLKSELHATDLQTAYGIGKQDALKDLPKWKKCVGSTGPFIDDFRGEDYLYLKDYVIKVSELFEKLPKEE